MSDPMATPDQLQLLWCTVGAIAALTTWILVKARAGTTRSSTEGVGGYVIAATSLICLVVAISSLAIVR